MRCNLPNLGALHFSCYVVASYEQWAIRIDMRTQMGQHRLDATRKGKPLVRGGRKATGLPELAGPPK